jgi:tight adherence protein B
VTPVLLIVVGLLLAGVTGYALMVRWRAEQQREAALTGRLDALRANVYDFDQSEPDPVEAWVATLPPVVRTWIGAADIRLRRELVLGYLAISVVLVILAMRFINPLVGLALVAALVLGPVAFVRQLALYRMTKFANALPYFLDSLRQLLIVGNSFQQALVRSTEGASPEIRRYLDAAVRRIRNGAPVADAITAAAERVASVELHMLASAVRINQRFGGAIGPVLSDLADLLRTRVRVNRELGAATAEVRMSSWILGSLPVVSIITLALVRYEYISFLWRDPTGHSMLGFCAFMEVVGVLLMRRMMRLDF